MGNLDSRMYGVDLFGDPIVPTSHGKLADNFGAPPLTVLNTRAGYWVDRKAAWLDMGIAGEVGRLGCYDRLPPSALDDYERLITNSATGSGVKACVSVFDPVLCELVYSWFCLPGGQIVDPFAGGSVRGIIAGFMGYNYWGCDLQARQIAANREQADKIRPDVLPVWVCGDSSERMRDAPEADLVFSCPPYGNLEKYSDDKADLSNMDYHAFILAYRRIIYAACNRLRNSRFACFVVGDYRDGKGYMRDLCGETVRAFALCGLQLYNRAVLVNQVGSAAMRASRTFGSGRKLTKTHQDVLVFCKGDWRTAVKTLGNRGEI